MVRPRTDEVTSLIFATLHLVFDKFLLMRISKAILKQQPPYSAIHSDLLFQSNGILNLRGLSLYREKSQIAPANGK